MCSHVLISVLRSFACSLFGRISQLEMLDEIEELDLVLAHYAITWGAVWPDGTSANWMDWDMLWDSDMIEDDE